ncbi:MAG: hypothetical protein KDA93_01270 [Planctomycetaceae bacterium]|nr:hypothetical protein [Planctomycetaceae bacterium]
MSDELSINSEEIELSSDAAGDEEFEEISSDEVDRVVEAIDELIATIQSENIQAILEDASNSIFALVYDEEDLEAMEDEIQDEAA